MGTIHKHSKQSRNLDIMTNKNWNVESEEQNISPLVAAYCQIMFLLKSSKNPIDPSCFLDAFSRFTVSMERGDFVVNSQQDVPEVLNYILDNFCGVSVLAQDQIKVVIRNRITCMNCLQSDDRDDIHMIMKFDIHMIMKLNVAGNVNSAFGNFLNEEVILDCECPVCLYKHNASLEKRVVVAGKYLIIHLKRYLLDDGGWVKDMSLVNCVMEQLSFSIDLDDEVHCRKFYHFVASIYHSGTLAAGHYTAHVLHKQDSQWLLCMIRQCFQYNLQRLTINLAMCFFMSCLNYFIFVVFVCFFYAEQGVDTFLLFGCDFVKKTGICVRLSVGAL